MGRHRLPFPAQLNLGSRWSATPATRPKPHSGTPARA